MMIYPNEDQVISCPHCKGQTAFTCAGQTANGEWHAWSHGTQSSHKVAVRHCRTCGKPVINYSSGGKEELYPKLPERALAPDELRTKNAFIADDYDEAVKCDPVSQQAAIILLARCATQILVDNCEDVKKNDGLKDQFDAAIAANKITGVLAEQVKDLSDTRNQVGHVWYDDQGSVIRIVEDDVAWWFDIIDWLIDLFYVQPVIVEQRIARIQGAKAEKKQGDKA